MSQQNLIVAAIDATGAAAEELDGGAAARAVDFCFSMMPNSQDPKARCEMKNWLDTGFA